LHQQEVAAVVADMTLPKMGGTTLFEELRQLSPALPVILVTSYGEDETIRRLREQGLRWVIHKPFRVHELAGVLQQALEE